MSQATIQITLTEAALARVQYWLAKQKDAIGIRFGVKATGCSGLSYVVDVAKDKFANDLSHPLMDGVLLLVDEKSLPFINGMTVDYVSQGLNSGFKFSNPNEKGSCGCGESFTI